MPALLTIATCSVQWFIVGYTLAYGSEGAVFGSLEYLFHRGVLAEPVGTIPAILFSEFQLVFEATVCAIAVGGICERGRLLPIVPFIFVSLLQRKKKSPGDCECLVINKLWEALVNFYLLPTCAYGVGWRIFGGNSWSSGFCWRYANYHTLHPRGEKSYKDAESLT
jgi:hypothetical protein